MSETAAAGKKGQPGAIWIIRTDDIRTKEYSRLQMITPAQAAALLQVTLDTLQTLRETGQGPAYMKIGRGASGAIRYQLADIYDWIESRKQINTAGGRVCTFATLQVFIANAARDDRFIFVEANNVLYDFWYALEAEIQDCETVLWLTLAEYIERLKTQTERRFAEHEREALKAITVEHATTSQSNLKL